MKVKIYDPNTRAEISPEEARKKALDKTAYDQNYECQFNDENMCLLTYELIQSAERNGIPIDDQAWSERSLERLRQAERRPCSSGGGYRLLLPAISPSSSSWK